MSGAAEPRVESGPAMKALPNDRWRTFVLHYCSSHNTVEAYTIAFNHPEPEKRDACRANGCRLLHDERVQEAVREVAQRQLRTLAPLAVKVFEDVARNPQVAPGDRVRAAQAIADRTGLHAVTETVKTTRIGQDPNQNIRIADMAKALGIDVSVLLGRRIEPPTIDLTATEVEPEPVVLNAEEPEQW